MRTAVDVLSMSATPIPRTLEMAVTGIREMSTLATPPEERHPVLTFVGAYDEKQITAAIRRELLREGQVFFVHNKVSSIEKAASRLRELVPEARIATAHGQMGEHRLEQVVEDFWEKRFDVLVCTTIVETGLDISNANTLIVERADMLGLSQLHQLRGRVGRGRERAYAYFLYPPEKPMTETAHDRLRTIASNTDLGAGMQVAMKDLEIRGAGNLLGGEQSGHIARRRLRPLRATHRRGRRRLPRRHRPKCPPRSRSSCPSTPICRTTTCRGSGCASRRTRSSRRSRRYEAVDEIEAELRDRYGAPPEPVDNLLEVARLRVVARRARIGDIGVQGKVVRFGPVKDLRESQQLRLMRLYPGTIVKEALGTILVPAPMTARVGGKPLRDVEVARVGAAAHHGRAARRHRRRSRGGLRRLERTVRCHSRPPEEEFSEGTSVRARSSKRVASGRPRRCSVPSPCSAGCGFETRQQARRRRQRRGDPRGPRSRRRATSCTAAKFDFPRTSSSPPSSPRLCSMTPSRRPAAGSRTRPYASVIAAIPDATDTTKEFVDAVALHPVAEDDARPTSPRYRADLKKATSRSTPASARSCSPTRARSTSPSASSGPTGSSLATAPPAT